MQEGKKPLVRISEESFEWLTRRVRFDMPIWKVIEDVIEKAEAYEREHSK